ncbi:hypothetical protein [Ottowia sp.]|uniref:hypothetical protein n=1 Tax=Ottowia sp. TaxID=1898956 RepID=UPI0025F2384F|nr:hypothetical protein [Ottowia sp.]MBK6616076.1 hypothetical protein [Ottowia sp.]
MAIAISWPKVWERFRISAVIFDSSKSAECRSGMLDSRAAMRPLFSALAVGYMMEVIKAIAAFAAVGQCSSSFGCAHGSELNSFSCPASVWCFGIPGTTVSYKVMPK